MSTHMNRTGYRCAEHLNRPVNWRGAGCPECDAEQRERDLRRSWAGSPELYCPGCGRAAHCDAPAEQAQEVTG